MGRTQESAEVGHSGGSTDVEIRPAGSPDTEAIRSFITGLSRRTQYLRFFAGVSPPSSALLRALCGTGNGADILVAACGGSIIGHAMAADRAGTDGTRLAHVGLVVADSGQQHGVGSALMRALLARAAARGARVVVMDVLPGNRRVLAMIGRHWPGARYEFAPDSVTVCACLAVPAVTAALPAAGTPR
jgi:GNAT superfamily N-acetyltransferase